MLRLLQDNLHQKSTEDANAPQVVWIREDFSLGPSRIGMARPHGADEIAEDNLAMEELEKDTFSASSRTRETRANWWISRAKARGIQPFPLDVQKLKLLGALLKKGDTGAARLTSRKPSGLTLSLITLGVNNWH